MSMIDDIKRDRERPQVKLMSMTDWRVKSDEPALGWVKVVGPCVPVQCPTLATDLNGEDYIARHAEARRIARVPDLEAALIAAEEMAESIEDCQCNGGVPKSVLGYCPAERLDAALAAYRAATGAA
ncbi:MULTISPECIES: hypothetical protein [unclassified Sulfitobacter]|uniref:hypothetical protein n=1 Tax=Sulfitobacter phage NYA-2014a TaxID=1526550 RepID=UPI0004E3FC04|nr:MULTISPECIES: hypothetical protein [unclassified Sulfitobacter]YP_009146228.1 hypothetical protein SUFP_054 [Sulfitobacter phage NYA-2014a]AIM40685.1 hypothetical protein SUFP_054 [Sulfitobacter phage NYA-2014a]PTA99605.1 hypothetical protein C8254_14365 [Sulfitobacter sp. CB-A]ULO21243.1 hypothetical protein IV89_001204 [Sulfitobacter sp. CB2047]